MQTQTQLEQDRLVEQKLQKLREIFADAPQMAKTALENKIRDLASHASEPRSQMESAGRTGSRQGALLQAQNGNFDDADKVGTVHDMRFVFIDDTKLLFATAYDGEWDPYIDDFATKIPDIMDIAFSAFEGWPGIHNVNATKDWIAKHQITAEGWFVANPDLTVAGTRRLERNGKALDEFLDKISA